MAKRKSTPTTLGQPLSEALALLALLHPDVKSLPTRKKTRWLRQYCIAKISGKSPIESVSAAEIVLGQ